MKSFLGSTAVLTVLSVVSAVDITLDIVNTNLAPDGFNRSVIVANGTYPGPPILLTKGDTLNVFVNNSLVDGSMRRSIAMDFDGIFVNTSNWWNEGSDFVASCPVGPNMTFTYNLPTGNQTGTFWYHSQLSAQYVDGLRGPLIIYDPEDPHLDLYDVDDVTTIIELGDWWQIVTPVLLANYESTGIVPVSDSGTINGVGRFQGGPEVPFPVFTVQQGKRYRFRLINESARNVFTVSFDDHNMTIIETDGVPNVPLVTDELMMLAGQRHSVVLVANQTVGNYWFNAPFVGGSPANNKAGHQNASLTRAILHYEGAPDEEPAGPFTLGPQNGTGGIIEPLLQPLVPVTPPDPDVTLNFTLSVVTGRAIWQINGVSYLPPLTPTLVKVLAGADTEASFNETENTFILPANATIEVNFPPSDDDEEHPFHLHGNNFWVIKGNFSDTPNTVNPLVRDTVGVGSTGTTVRFRTDQPGPMFFHCHIFWHKQAGLASVLLSGPDETREAEHPSNEWLNLCQAYRDLPEDAQ